MTEKADCSEADFDTYVSTESLLPNKMGRQIASSLPQTGKVTVYQTGDILISNIRPYFKKIWYADQAGTCSGDVLVFRAKQPEWASYLYSCLRNDSFFDFVMKGAKGTKMPRGDKKQMLTYEVSASPNQLVIGFMALALKHISTANKESEHLAALRDALLPKLMSGEVDVSKVNLTQLNSHLVVSSHRLPGHLIDPPIRVARLKSNRPHRRPHISEFRHPSETQQRASLSTTRQRPCRSSPLPKKWGSSVVSVGEIPA